MQAIEICSVRKTVGFKRNSVQTRLIGFIGDSAYRIPEVVMEQPGSVWSDREAALLPKLPTNQHHEAAVPAQIPQA
ncbi:MAG: hypothetical protein ACHQNE_04790 [Candidatus Kapaibacterium sp.]